MGEKGAKGGWVLRETNADKVLELLEEERKRLARDIHDGPAQSLTNVSMRLQVIRRLLESSQNETAIAELDRLQALMRTSLNDMRRLIFDLRPTFLENGLTEAIHRYAKRFSQSTGLDVVVSDNWGSPELSRSTEVALFRVCQEALNNTFKHADATSVEIVLTQDAKTCRIVVTDNGKGFDRAGHSLVSFGLQGMAERMTLVGGMLDVQSAMGKGTTVICEVSREDEP